MGTLLLAGLSNAAWSAALALAAAVAVRVWRHRPALAHGLWLLVLVKLVTPPLVSVRPPERVAVAEESIKIDISTNHFETADPLPIRAPASRPGPATPDAPTPPDSAAAEPVATDAAPETARRPWPWREAAVAVWAGGAVAWWGAVGLGVVRFRRLLRSARPAAGELRARVDRVADLLGLRRRPTVWVVPARIPPMLWALFGTPRLLLPEELWGALGGDGQDAVLAHELAHLKRRDDWVRRLEALTLGLYWWDPVAWWARREVERAEEECCDAWVLWALPGSAPAYAEALVATAAFLSGPQTPWPAGASGAGRTPLLKRRLLMILRDRSGGPTPRRTPRWALVVAGLTLVLLPAWAPPGPPTAPESVDIKVQKREAEPPAPDGGVPAEPGPGAAGGGAAPRKVRVSHPVVREVGDYRDFVGRVEAAQTVEVRARVGGTLERVHVRGGQSVEKGQLLFEIDPRPYSAELDKAAAESARAEGRLARASTALKRAETLRAKGIAGADDVEAAEAERNEARLFLQAARSSYNLVKLKVDATDVAAPISGVISRPNLSAGNFVAADATVLATINTTDPMEVAFDVDERTVLKLGHAKRTGASKTGLDPGLPVRVGLVDEDGFPHTGRVDSIDTRFDPAQATLRCRAAVPNPDGLLIPGLFARVRLVTGAPAKVLLIPEHAFISDSKGHGVLVVNERNVVEFRRVHLGDVYDGLRAITDGLKENDWVVTGRGDRSVPPGAMIVPERVDLSAPSEGHAPDESAPRRR